MANRVALDLNAEIGKCAVYLVDEADLDNDDPLLDPVAHIARTLFHSDLEYLRVVDRLTATLSLGAVIAGGLHVQSTVKHSILGAHGLASLPIGILKVDGVQVHPGTRAQATAASGGRYLYLGIDATDVFVVERRIIAGHDLPAVSFDIEALLLAPIVASGADLFDIDPASGLVMLGRNTFTNEPGYKTLKIKASGAEFFVSPPATTASHQANGGMRIVWPDGTIDDHGPYSGAFTGPTSYGMGE